MLKTNNKETERNKNYEYKTTHLHFVFPERAPLASLLGKDVSHFNRLILALGGLKYTRA